MAAEHRQSGDRATAGFFLAQFKIFASIVLHALDSTISSAREQSFHNSHIKKEANCATFFAGGGTQRRILSGVPLNSLNISFPCLSLDIFQPEGGDRMSNLLAGIRGDAVEVAGTRGFLSGISETSRKCLRPRVKSSLSQHVQRTSLSERFFFLFPPWHN